MFVDVLLNLRKARVESHVIIEGKIPGLGIQGESAKRSAQTKEFKEEFFRMPALGEEKMAQEAPGWS